MQKQKKIPLRMCLGCKEMKPKREMIRIVKNKEDEIFIDFKGKAAGRGSYICRNRACLEKAVSSKLLEKSFERKIGPEVYETLRNQLNEGEADDK